MSEESKKKEYHLDFGSYYESNQENTILDISSSFYSNYAIIQTSNRDVYIDFLEMPGIKKDGKMNICAKRIMLPHAVAQKLAEVILTNLEKSYKDGNIEQYQPSKSDSES